MGLWICSDDNAENEDEIVATHKKNKNINQMLEISFIKIIFIFSRKSKSNRRIIRRFRCRPMYNPLIEIGKTILKNNPL